MENSKRNNCQPSRLVFHALLLFFGAFLFVISGTTALAKEALNTPLDTADPVYFYGSSIEYGGKEISLDAKNIYIDATLSDETCAQYDHVYNDFKQAYSDGKITSGTASQPMNVWIAPYVYWMDDPDDPAIREGIDGDPIPYGLWINCSYLSLNGLTKKPENVVFAVNRGQSHGANGNFTMFYINGTGTHTENLTFGNYCCMDLVYPLKPDLNREKRTSTITQSQLCLTNGQKITADNCNFVSRLNSCPFVGGERIFFNGCHFECTDDSLPTSAIYLDCDFDFYSSRPFYSTSGTGSILLHCDFNIKHNSSQYLTKVGGVVTIIDSTFYSPNKNQYIGWTPNPSTSLRCYAGNVTVHRDYEDENGEKQSETIENYELDPDKSYDNVTLSTDSEAMKAFRLTYNGETIYNIYNLFKGTDNWDPLNQKLTLTAAAAKDGINYTDLPFALSASPSASTISDGNTSIISTSLLAFTGTTSAVAGTVTWDMDESLKGYITLTDNGEGTCTLSCKNDTLNVITGQVHATEASGLKTNIYVKATPKTQPAPVFSKSPSISLKSGKLVLDYTLSYKTLDDQSEITWYRCSDAQGSNPIPVAVSQNSTPLKQYTLGYADSGYYLKATITPKQEYTYYGSTSSVIYSQKITRADSTADPLVFDTDFSTFAYSRQPNIAPGFWTIDVYKGWLEDISSRTTTDSVAWKYGAGAVGYGDENFTGLIQMAKGSRMIYTPLKGTYNDMTVTLEVNPEKTAGQGFGSAKDDQFMDIYIKYDTTSLNGYALHLQRVAETANGIQASLVKYTNGAMSYIGEKKLTSAFNSTCTITLTAKGKQLTATMSTTHTQSEKQKADNLAHSIELTAAIDENTHGGTGVLLTGTAAEGNRVMLNQMTVNWSGKIDAEPVETKTAQNSGNTGNSGTDKTGSSSDSASTILKKGTTFIKNGLKFKVTKTAKTTGAVTITGVKSKKIKKLTIAGTVTYKKNTFKITAIGKKAFANCKKLKKIKITGKNLKKVGKNALKGIHKKCVISVPKAKKKAYKKLFKKKGQAKTVIIK